METINKRISSEIKFSIEFSVLNIISRVNYGTTCCPLKSVITVE
jgi:hypothetical protein